MDYDHVLDEALQKYNDARAAQQQFRMRRKGWGDILMSLTGLIFIVWVVMSLLFVVGISFQYAGVVFLSTLIVLASLSCISLIWDEISKRKLEAQYVDVQKHALDLARAQLAQELKLPIDQTIPIRAITEDTVAFTSHFLKVGHNVVNGEYWVRVDGADTTRYKSFQDLLNDVYDEMGASPFLPR